MHDPAYRLVTVDGRVTGDARVQGASVARHPSPAYRTVAVTFAVPTFELESAQRNAIRCSPGLSKVTLTLKLSCEESAMPSSGKINCHVPPSTLYSPRTMRLVKSVAS